MTDVSILTVTWNSADFILRQIESVKYGADNLSFEQFVADNNSTDGTVTAIRQKYPDLPLEVFSENRGFGAANNEIAKKATGKYFLLLNPDMELQPGSVKALIDLAEKYPKAGVVGGLLFDETGKVKANALPRRFPTFFDQAVILTKLHHIFPKLLKKYLRVDLDVKSEQTVDSVQGSFMLVRRELYEKLGHLFDPRYFIWFEDVDLCREAKKHGFEVWFTPTSTAKDFGGRSFAKRKLFWKQWHLSLSMLEYFFKWENPVKGVFLSMLVPCVLGAVFVYDLIHDYEA